MFNTKDKNALEAEEDQPQSMECPNCKEIIPGHLAVKHTIQCYRNATKCRVCNQVIHKDKKRQHLEKWRNLDVSAHPRIFNDHRVAESYEGDL